MNTYNKIVTILITSILILMGVYLDSAMVLATEDDNFSRPLYSLQYVNEHDVGVTFNSIKLNETDAEWASKHNISLPLVVNETNFVGAREDTGKNEGAKNVWESSSITAEDGKTYVVRLYVHNNSQSQESKDTQVRFYVPYGSASTVTVSGYLKSSNAIPTDYSDTIVFKSKNGIPFSLQYIYGSALLENGGFAKGGVQLSDSINNQGNNGGSAEGEWTKIGYNDLDGIIPGCYEYINYVTIMVRVVYDYDFTVETKVRLANSADSTWQDTVEAKVGDKVEFQIQYKNTSDYTQHGVVIKDVLPASLRYVEGTAKLYNVLYPSGLTFDEGIVVTSGVKIGNYTAGSNAFIRLTAEVISDNLACGLNTLYNWGQVGVGAKTLQNDATVRVQNDREFIIKVTALGILIVVCLVIICIYLYKIQQWKQTYK